MLVNFETLDEFYRDDNKFEWQTYFLDP